MADREHVSRLADGVEAWNRWRSEPRGGENAAGPDLSGADVSGADLTGANLSGCNLDGAVLLGATFDRADLTSASLRSASLSGIFRHTRFCNANLTDAVIAPMSVLHRANFSESRLAAACLNGVIAELAEFEGADLTGAKLRDADLTGSSFVKATLSGADLTGSDLSYAAFVETKLDRACLDGCVVYGTSVWGVSLHEAQQNGLIVTGKQEPQVTVDDLELAQFVYLLLNNRAVRRVIDTITSKVVLILGSFSSERKPMLDALRDALRNINYTPILFDFEKPASRNMTETVSTIAHMARFVIADLTDAKSVRQELQLIVPHLPSVPVQPLILAGQEEFAMFDHFRQFRGVLTPVRYESQEALIASLPTLIANVEAAVKEVAPWSATSSVEAQARAGAQDQAP